MGNRNKGLYQKFIIKRADGQHRAGKKHEDCEYFVLDLTHDPHALPAIKAYADSCRADYPLLAADLDNILSHCGPDGDDRMPSEPSDA
jgi:hypothetical protein